MHASGPVANTHTHIHIRTKHSCISTALSQLRVLLAERTGQRETGLMAAYDLHALFTLHVNVTGLLCVCNDRFEQLILRKTFPSH